MAGTGTPVLVLLNRIPRLVGPCGGLCVVAALATTLLSCEGTSEDESQHSPIDPEAFEWADIHGGAYYEPPPVAHGIQSFQLMAFEVTQEQYSRWWGRLPSGNSDCPTCPVLNVSYEEATDFCTALGGRLPSEVEWRYAYLGGNGQEELCVDNEECRNSMGWCPANACSRAHPVGLLMPNPYGLYDMLGNAAEWAYGGCSGDETDFSCEYKGLPLDCFRCSAISSCVIGLAFDDCSNHYDSFCSYWVASTQNVGFRCAR